MIIKMMTKAANDGEYIVALQKRRRFMMALTAIGLLSISLSRLLGEELLNTHHSAYLSGLYAGIGCGLILAGVFFTFRINKLLNDEPLRRQKRIEETDERNQMIVNASLLHSVILFFVGLMIAMLTAGFINMTVFYTLYAVFMAFAAVFILVMLINQKRF